MSDDELRQLFRQSVIDVLADGWTQQRIDDMLAAYRKRE